MKPSSPVARGSSRSRALWLWPFFLSNAVAKSLKCSPQFFSIDGLLQEEHSQRPCSFDVRIGYIATLEDDRKLAIPQQHLFGHLESIDMRHVDIENEARAGATALGGKELSGRFESHRSVPERLDESAHGVSERPIIIDYYNDHIPSAFAPPTHAPK
jgi:hypothetical protein